MNIKKAAQKLAQVRDNIKSNGHITDEDKDALLTMVRDKIEQANKDLSKLPKRVTDRMPLPENDNNPLTHEQNFRLRIMEKTGTGSASIH